MTVLSSRFSVLGSQLLAELRTENRELRTRLLECDKELKRQ
jgi:hypothetical protein